MQIPDAVKAWLESLPEPMELVIYSVEIKGELVIRVLNRTTGEHARWTK